MTALYAYWRSSSTYRVRIVLEHKQVSYQVKPVHLLNNGGEQNQPEFRALNPMGQIPLLEIEEAGQIVHLAQSVAICEYLEERFPEPSLLPQDSLQRARMRQIVEVINSGIQPVQNLRVLQAIDALGGSKLEWGKEAIERGFVALEALLKQTAGTYCVGDSLSLADAFLVPQIYNARRFKVDLEPFKEISRVEAECLKVSAFQKAHPDQQPDAQLS